MKRLVQILFLLSLFIGFYWGFIRKTPEEKQFTAVLAAAKQGNVEAQAQAGALYAQGRGTAQNGEQALYWYRQAALEGDTTALWQCAALYIQGNLVKQDLAQAVPFLLLAAKQGSLPARKELSRFYAEGLGELPQHGGESLYWQFLASQQGDEAAQQVLVDAEQNQPELYAQVQAFVTDLQEAQAGDAQARLRVGQAYLTGNPIVANAEEAEKWLQLAWKESKLPEAGLLLAQGYQTGKNFVQDETKANVLWNELVEIPYPPAQYALGEAAYKADPPEYDKAFAWFSNAAANRYAPGQYMAGFMLMQGLGAARSVPLAVTFFRSAAEQNHTAAQYVLGQIYYKGLGLPQNRKAGRMWLKKAAQNGSAAAQALLNGK